MTEVAVKQQKEQRRNQLVRIAFFVILSFCYLFIFVNGKGQPIIKADIDGQFHFSRMMSLENIWNSPVNFEYFNHTGQIVNLMYPWAILYPMYLLVKLTGNIVLGYYIYFLIMTFICLELTYWCVKKMKVSQMAAIISAVLYAFSVCRTSDIYYRIAVGEAIGMTFFPLVLLGIYQIFYEDKPKWHTLVTGMTLLVYSHIISVVLAILLVGVFFIINLIRKKVDQKRIIALLKATGMTLILSLGFFIPMLQMLFSVDLNKPVMYSLFKMAYKPEDFLMKSISNTVDAGGTFNIAFIIVIIVLVVNWKRIKGFFKDALIMGIIFTVMATQIFPWDLFQKILAIIQFPGRLIGLATLLYAVAFGQVMTQYLAKHSLKQAVKITLLLVGGIVFLHFGTLDSISNINEVNVGNNNNFYMKAIKENASFNGRDDYAPKKADADGDQINNQMICANAQWHNLERKVTANTITYKYNSPNETTAFLPVYYYSGEQVKQNGKVIKAQQAADGATLVNLKQGENQFEVSYKYTPLARIAWTISLIACVIFNAMILIKKRKNNKA